MSGKARALEARFSAAQLTAAAIMTGGAVGAVSRAGVSRGLPVHPGSWPWATFIVNIAGTLILAGLTTRLAEIEASNPYWRPLIGTGFCGALTTFSTFELETIKLARNGHALLAMSYASASIAAGTVAAIVGTVAARRHRHG